MGMDISSHRLISVTLLRQLATTKFKRIKILFPMNTFHLASNILRLQPNVRSLLRRNVCLLLKAVCGSVPDISKHNRKLLMDFTEHQAQSFCFVLYMLLSRFDDEQICDYLDGLKHLIIDERHRK